MKKYINTIKVYIVTILLLLPILLLFNESNTFLPNLIGFCYMGILFIVFRGKVAKKAFKALIKANNSLGL